MKRIVLAGIAAAGLAATSHAQSFPSVNSVGFVPVTVPAAGGLAQVGCNLKTTGGASDSIGVADLFGSNQLIRANSAAGGDQIYIWDENAAPPQYVIVYQRVDGRYRLTTGAYTNYPVRTGSAVWIKSPSTSTVARTIYMDGDVVGAPQFQRTQPAGLTMLANPYCRPWYLNGTNQTWVLDGATRGSAGSADRISVWNGSQFDIYYLRSANSNWCNTANNAVLTNPIPVGAGFWYLARSNFVSRINK